MAKTIIEELVTRLGFDIDDKKLEAFNKKSIQLRQTLKKIATIAFTSAAAINAYITKIALYGIITLHSPPAKVI